MLCELIVVIAKQAFGTTADDVIDTVHERLAQYHAQAYEECLRGPVAAPRTAIQAAYAVT